MRKAYMDPNQEYGAPVSNLPPLAWLSGLNLGQAGLSGEADPSMSAGEDSKVQPGMEGGLGLDALTQLLQAQQGAAEGGPGTASGLLQGIKGTIGQGTLAQGGPGYGMAGGMSQPVQAQTGGQQGGYTAGQSQGGGQDGMVIIKQALGVAQKLGKGLAGASDSGYDTEGTSQLGQTSINPQGYSLTGPGAAPSGSPEALAQFFKGELGSSLLQDPVMAELITKGFLQGSLTPSDLADFGSLGGSQLGGYRAALGEGTIGPDLGEEMAMAAPGGSAGFSLGGNNMLNTGAVPGDTNWLGAAQGGIGAGMGLLNVLQGIQGGNAMQGAGGAIQSIGGLGSLLQNSPELAEMLGLSGETLGAIGQGAGAAGGALGIAGGLQAMLNGQYGPGATQLASGLISAYPQVASLLGYGGSGAAGGGSAALGALGAIYGLMGQGDPTGGAQAGASLTGLAATAAGSQALASALGPALTGTLAGSLGAAAPIIAGIVSFFGEQDASRIRNSWNAISRPATQLATQAFEGQKNFNDLVDQARAEGITDPAILQQLLQVGAKGLFGSYRSVQGPGYPFTAGDYIKRAPDQQPYLDEFYGSQKNIMSLIGELQRQGVDLGKVDLGEAGKEFSRLASYAIGQGGHTESELRGPYGRPLDVTLNPDFNTLGAPWADLVTGGPLYSMLALTQGLGDTAHPEIQADPWTAGGTSQMLKSVMDWDKLRRALAGAPANPYAQGFTGQPINPELWGTMGGGV